MPEQESKSQPDTTPTDGECKACTNGCERCDARRVTQVSADDWTELRWAVEEMDDTAGDIVEAHSVIRRLVPKLLDAYAELWEMSIALTQAVEQWKSEGQGGKLLVADESEVREFGK